MSRIHQSASRRSPLWFGWAIRPALALGVLGLCLTGWAEEPAAKDKPADTRPKVSTFTFPTTLEEGRDPFHPKSTRIIAVAKPPEQPAPGPAKLVLKGISGSANRPLALINNRTFAEGDEQDVSTAQGRVTVKCLSIDGLTVKILVQGQIKELMLREELRAAVTPPRPQVGKDL
jgi:hypothetical protein